MPAVGVGLLLGPPKVLSVRVWWCHHSLHSAKPLRPVRPGGAELECRNNTGVRRWMRLGDRPETQLKNMLDMRYVGNIS